MIKFVLKIFNLNGSSFQIRSKQRTTSADTQKCGTSFDLSEFQSDTIKQTSNIRVNESQICIVNHDHSTSITWLCTHIIVRGSKRSNLRKKNSQAQDSTFCSREKPYQATYLGCKDHFQVRRLAKKDPREMSHHLHQSQSRRCVTMTCP
jgi:hypothetical protein